MPLLTKGRGFDPELPPATVKPSELNADNTLNEATIVGYKIVSKKVMKEKNGWRTMVLLEYKIS